MSLVKVYKQIISIINKKIIEFNKYSYINIDFIVLINS